ncbi:MAG: hypothetical protein J5792_03405 [Bacteroidales bacterium]|nr:hypothetical protein [Bacteroidales bacterium]
MKKLVLLVILSVCSVVTSTLEAQTATNGCDSALNGVYYVGDSLSDFPNIGSAVSCLTQCGVSGPVEFRIKSGMFLGFSIHDVIPGTSDSNTVTFSSASRCRDSVRIINANAIALANTGHLVFRDLTLDGQLTGVRMDSNVTNVEFRNCNILAPLSTNNVYSTVMYMGVPNSDCMLDNVRFIANNMVGGAQNFYFYYACGSSNAMLYCTGVTIDSNLLCDASICSVRTYYYGKFRSFSHNTIEHSTGRGTFHGINSQYYSCWSRVEGNRIRIQADGNAYGMYFTQVWGRDTSRIINNEIIVRGAKNTYGILSESIGMPVWFVHNSIFTQSDSVAYGLGISAVSPSYYPIICNNILANSGNDGYPLYIPDNYINRYKFKRDYNNYYSDGAWLAYLNGNMASMDDIRKVDTNCDQHSLSVTPVWKDSGSLDMDNSMRFVCPVFNGVDIDLNGNLRIFRTAMGCHKLRPDSNDAMLVGFDGMKWLSSAEYVPVKVIVRNMGRKAIQTATIGLVIDKMRCPDFTYRPSVPLEFQQTDTVSLGNYQLSDGLHHFTAFISMAGDTNSFNDSIVLSRVVCDKALCGTYVVGASANADFAFDDFDIILRRMQECGVTGDITFALEDGTYYGAIDFSPVGKAMGGHHLTLTSLSDDRNSVLIADSGTVLILGKDICGFTLKNLSLQHLSQKGSVVQLNFGCRNVEILHNNLFGDTVGRERNAAYGIVTQYEYIPENGNCNDIRILGNLIRGGYVGIYLTGLSYNNVCRNVEVDYNEISGQGYGPAYLYALHLASFCHNRLRSRYGNTDTMNYVGLECNGVQADSIVGNVIDLTHCSAYSSNIKGMSLRNFNLYGGGSALVANNFIQLRHGYGVSAASNNMRFIHNTVRITGDKFGCGYRHSGSSHFKSILRGNIFDVSPSQTALNVPNIDDWKEIGLVSDYNNFCNHGGSTLVSSSGNLFATLADFRNYFETDFHSVSVNPVYADSSTMPDVRMDGRMLVLRSDEVRADIHEKRRILLTNMGAVQAGPRPNGAMDAVLYDFGGTSLKGGNFSPVMVTLHNLSADTLTSATIHWTANGVRQNDFNWTGRLGFGDCDTVTIALYFAEVFTYNRFVAWVESPNSMVDVDHSNDTARLNTYVCSGALAGSYTVGGAKADFADADEMKEVLYNYGVSGPVVMRFRSGEYGVLRLTDTIPGSSVTNRVTLLAEEGAEVVFNPMKNGAALICENLPFVTFQGLTFGDRDEGVFGVQLKKNCSHLTFRQCNIYACTTTTNWDYRAFSYDNDRYSGCRLENICLIGNNVMGGYYNIYFSYASGDDTSKSVPSAIVDSNTLTYAYYSAIYTLYYGNFPSISHNTMVSRYGMSGSTQNYYANSNDYYGLYTSYYRQIDRIEGNRVYIRCRKKGYGFYLYSLQMVGSNHNDYEFDTIPTLVANNEIRGYGGQLYGIVLVDGHCNVEIHHNSVLLKAGSTYALYLSTYKTVTRTNVSRNLLCAEGRNISYALYIEDSAYGPALGLRSWNNLYSSKCAASACGRDFSLEEFVSYTRQDSHSISLLPHFVDTAVGLDVCNYWVLACPSTPIVQRDINGVLRLPGTTMGCYNVIDSFTVELSVNDTTMGRATGAGTYVQGSEVTLTAIPFAGYRFVSWEDGDTVNPRIVTVLCDTLFTAIFEEGNAIPVIPPQQHEEISVYSYGNEIFIKGAAGHTACVSNAAGQLVRKVECGELQRLTMPVRGVYFVRIGRFLPKKVLVFW